MVDGLISMPPIVVALPVVPVRGQQAPFPVRRIWCVGQNYADHAREMGGDPDRAPPFFFSKPGDAVVPGGGDLPYPPQTGNLHHEVELVAAIGIGGSEIAAENALAHVFGYAVALDMTRRDLQAEAKAAGRPWAFSKGFDQSCPIAPIVPAAEIGHPQKGAITLSVDGVLRQTGDLADMIWSVAEAIAFLSRFVSLAPGDLVMTGTPAGVGPVKPGERIVGACSGDGFDLGEIAVRYGAA